MGEIFSSLKLLMPSSIDILDFIQIVIICIVLYYCVKTIKGTRAWILAKGLAIIGLAYIFFYATGMTVLQYILQSLLSGLMVAVVIMIQPELQKIVEKIGTNKFSDIIKQFKKNKQENKMYETKTIEEVVHACESMSAVKTGALIVFERAVPLTEYIESGISLRAKVSSQLLVNTFEKNTPLHDGAVIIKEDKIEAATCYLPLSQNPRIAKSLGTRHRAAIGVSEVTDAIVVIVSEETGSISVCKGGQIKHNVSRTELYNELAESSIKNHHHTNKKNKKSLSAFSRIMVAVISVLIWGIVVNVNDPIVSKTFYNIPVEIVNEHVLADIDQAYRVVQADTVNVEITGHRSEVEALVNENIYAVADFSEMSIVYAVPIKVSLKDTNMVAEIEIKSDDIMKLELEEVIQQEIAITVTTTGEVKKGYYLSKATPITPSIVVAGPKSLVNTIGKAEAIVDVSNRYSESSIMSSIVLYDKNGTIIDNNKISLSNETVRVSIEIFKTKTLKAEIQLSDTENYKLVKYSIDNITIAASADVLASLETLTITLDPKQVDINSKTMLINLQLYLPPDVYLPSTQEETVEITYEIKKIEQPPTEIVPGDSKKASGED